MKYQAFTRTATAVLSAALMTTGAIAQTSAPTRVDTAPAPAEERSSLGAVVLMDDPVIARRDAMESMMARSAPDTRSMGAGPARILRQEKTKDDLDAQRTRDALEFHERGPAASTPK